MGSYTFKWEHDDAEEAFVTGTFDKWQKSVRLDRRDGVFQQTVDLAAPADKIYYKFVVDNRWTINESAPHEADKDGNINNFLTRHDLCRPSVGSVPISTLTESEASPLAMAGKKNKQKKQAAGKAQPQAADAASSADTSAAEIATAGAGAGITAAAPAQTKSDDLATPSDFPGGFPVTPVGGDDETLRVNPLPAAPGAVNPISLAPGQKIPPSLASQDMNENVKLDKASYEKSDALPGTEMLTQLPPVSKNTIPESSLPMGNGKNATINSVGIGATTLDLAGKVPLESEVPKVVEESQKKAGAAPEASAVAREVQDKSKVEGELKDKVKKAPATSEGTSGFGTEKTERTGLVAGAAATTGGAVAAAAMAAKNTLAERAAPAFNDVTTAATEAANRNLPDSVKQKLPESAQNYLAAGEPKDDPRAKVSSQVPGEVKKSISEAGKSPEAAANTSAVAEKKEVESELLKQVKPAPAVGDAKAAAGKPGATKAGAADAIDTKAAGSKAADTKTTGTQPADTKTTGTQPADTKAIGTQPADTKAIGTQATNTKAAETQPETVKPPAAALATATQPEIVKPEAAKTSATKPQVVEPEATKATSAKSEAARTEVTKPEAAITSPTKPEAAGSEATRSEATRPEAVKKEAARAEAINPKTAVAAAPNNADTQPADLNSKPAQTPADKKKRHRLSSIFIKIKEKLSDKK